MPGDHSLPKHPHGFSVPTGDVGILFGVEGQLVLGGQVHEGLHRREIGDVPIADLAQ